MNNENIIRDEGNEFGDTYVERFVNYGGHKDFIEKLKIEMLNFYSPEAKMIFLDQIKIKTQFYKTEHLDTCTNEECTKEKTFSKMLFFLQQEIDELPKILKDTSDSSKNERSNVFISYSHKDKLYLEDLKRHFKPLVNRVFFWDDSRIGVGQKWKDEIKTSLNKAKIAILLISADFFNSDFILENEIPPLLELAETQGATILSVILKPCLFEEFPQLSQYQAINSPQNPISSMNENDKETMWVELTRQVKYIIDKK